MCTDSTDSYQVTLFFPVAGGDDNDEEAPLPKKPCLDRDGFCEKD